MGVATIVATTLCHAEIVDEISCFQTAKALHQKEHLGAVLHGTHFEFSASTSSNESSNKIGFVANSIHSKNNRSLFSLFGIVINSGDTAFLFVCTALVQFMTPGLACFYGGLVRTGTAVSIMLQCMICLGIVFILWFVIAFSIAFGENLVVIGNPATYGFYTDVNIHSPLLLNGAVNPAAGSSVPGLLFATYQAMFAVITPALTTGAFADRVYFGPYVLFIVIWTLVVYAPVAHWVWGGGFMQQWGVFDWAGGIVVHTSAGFGALGCLPVVGSRHKDASTKPHSVPLVILGTAMLWFGWFGFNGGPAMRSDGTAAVALVNTQIAGSVAMCFWMMMDYLMGRRPGAIGACTGAVAGLATVTPCAGYVQPWGGLVLGLIAAAMCWGLTEMMKQFGSIVSMDDALDVWAVHGMGGFLGTAFLGALADPPHCAHVSPGLDAWCVNPGTVTRSGTQFAIQLGCASLVAVYAFVTSYALLKLISLCLRVVPPDETQMSLDKSEHGEDAYTAES